jgi:hypothetical protein
MKTVIRADSFEWLPANRDQGSIITSLPDASEIGMERTGAEGEYLSCAVTFHLPDTGQSIIDNFSESWRWGDVLTAMSSIALTNCPRTAQNIPLK